MGKPWRKPTRLGDEAGEPFMRFVPSSADVAELETPGGTFKLSRRGARVLADAMAEWAADTRRLELWGPARIQSECGVSEATLHRWRNGGGFPRPAAQLASGPVWEASTVRGWVKHRRPRRGRPRAS